MFLEPSGGGLWGGPFSSLCSVCPQGDEEGEPGHGRGHDGPEAAQLLRGNKGLRSDGQRRTGAPQPGGEAFALGCTGHTMNDAYVDRG